uniref:Ovule protein n=1 Tax=Heterorhabditis bacteriophora TaxID=37862 RepID=A0A1I7XBB1_HETBA
MSIVILRDLHTSDLDLKVQNRLWRTASVIALQHFSKINCDFLLIASLHLAVISTLRCFIRKEKCWIMVCIYGNSKVHSSIRTSSMVVKSHASSLPSHQL